MLKRGTELRGNLRACVLCWRLIKPLGPPTPTAGRKAEASKTHAFNIVFTGCLPVLALDFVEHRGYACDA